jgi:hypothetical protein
VQHENMIIWEIVHIVILEYVDSVVIGSLVALP